MEPRLRTFLALRWIAWVFSAVSFGIVITYFLIDITFYYWISNVTRSQVVLTLIIHLYMYLSAIWMSVKPQSYIAWAGLDIIFGLLAAAAAGTSQPSLQEYCTGQSLTLYWSASSNFGFLPADQVTTIDSSTLTATLSQSFNQMACGFNAAVIVCNVILICLFITTAWLGFKQYRGDRESRRRHRVDVEKFLQHSDGYES